MSENEEFFSAISNNDLKAAKNLVKNSNVDINYSEPRFGKTPLSYSAYLGLTKCTDYLLSLNADLNKPDGNDMTPLMVACSNGQAKGSKIALKLIESGANVNYVRKEDEMTALKFAVGSCKPEVIGALVQGESDVDGPQNTDQTALMLAARNNNVEALKILVKAGANTALECKLPWAEGLTALGLAKLEKHKKATQYLSSVEST